MEYPNSGSLVPSTIRKSEKSPDFFGSIKVDPAFLKDAIARSSGLVEIKLSGWKRQSKAGNNYLSIAVDTKVQQAPKKEESDPWA